MFVITPENQIALEAAVVYAATIYERKAFRGNGKYTRVFHLSDFDSSFPGLTVKYTDYVTLVPEYTVLEHVYALALEDGDGAPHIPRPIHLFRNPKSVMGYIIMERIDSCAVSDEELQAKSAEAVLWMRSKHYPATGPFGAVCKSHVPHSVFKWFESPHEFTSIGAVEKFLNSGIASQRRYDKTISDISLEGENVVLTQSDMHAVNFGVASDGRSIIYDFDSIRALPLSFADFSLLRTTEFAAAVSRYIFKDEDERLARRNSPSLESMSAVRRKLFIGANRCLGVDENGDKVPYQRKTTVQ